MKITRIIHFLWLLGLPLFVIPQEKPHIKFTDIDGLAGNTVHSIIKDKNGFLWIGTDSGLSKFDGTTFKNFYKKDGLPGNRIWALASDSKNRIYVGCYLDGIAIIENDRVVKILSLNEDERFNSIRQLHYSEYFNTIVIGTEYGIHLLKNDSVFILRQPVETKNKLSVLDITENNETIYFSALNSNGFLFQLDIDKFNPANSIIKNIDKFKFQPRFTLNIFNNNLYTNIYYKLVRSSLNSIDSLESILETEKSFLPWSSCVISSNEILYGGLGDNSYKSGLKVLNIDTEELTDFPYNLDSYSIFNLFFDSDTKIVWACTSDGLYALPDSPFEKTDISSVKDIIDINIFNGITYILGKKGLYTLNNNEIKLKFSAETISSRILKSRNTLYPDYIRSGDDLERQDRLIILNGLTLKNNELFLYSNKGNIQITETGFGKYLPFDNYNFYGNTQDGYYYVPSYEKARYYKDISKLKYDILQSKGLQITDVNNIAKLNKTYFFLSYYKGLYAYHDSTIFILKGSNPSFDNHFTGLDIAPNGEMWCTSAGGNLYNIGFDDSLFIKRTWSETNSGIIGNNYKWLRFNDSCLFIGSNKNLAVLPISELYKHTIKSMTTFNEFNGYPYTSTEKSFKDDDGNIYVFTDKELIKIKKDISTNKKAKLYIKNVEINNQPFSADEIKNATLKSSTNQILIEWRLLKYPLSKNVVYEYCINQGIWNTGNVIKFESIKPGNYSIEIRAKDIETSIQYQNIIIFKISKPFWLTWWFIAFFILAIASTVFLLLKGYFTHKRIQQEEQNRINNQLNDLHIKSLQSQMNPHFIFNSLNSIQNFILSNNTEDAINYLGTLGAIIRMNLENIAEEFIPLAFEIEFLKKYINVEKMRFKKQLDITIANRINDFDKILIPPMLIQPLVENAIKHGVRQLKYKGNIIIDFSLTDDCLVVTVTDNGIGMEKASALKNQNQKSIGLSLIHKRLDLLNQKNGTDKFKIEITDLFEDRNSTGTKVELILPQIRK